MLQKKIAEIITKLKKVREEEGISYQKIVELVENNGGTVSVSTVKRVFSEGSEAFGWQYENTLKPIADAVLGIYGPSEAATADEADALKAIIDYKSDKIMELTAQLERCEESYRRRIDFLKEQIALKDSRIDRRDEMIEKLIETFIDSLKEVNHGKSKKASFRKLASESIRRKERRRKTYIQEHHSTDEERGGVSCSGVCCEEKSCSEI